MTDRPQDTDLRARFDAQRQEDAQHAPPFAEMLARVRAEAASSAQSETNPAARLDTAAAAQSNSTPAVRSFARPTARRIFQRRYRIGALAAAAAIAALIVTPRMRSGDDAFEQAVRAFQSNPALGAWQSPTDGLLNLPGDGLLSSMPTVGAWPQ